MKHSDKNCECYRCKYGEAAYQKRVKREIKKHGFIVELVAHDCGCPNHTNYHTHGVYENFRHLDLQICFPLPQNITMQLFHNMVDAIKNGRVYQVGVKYSGIVNKYNVEFISAVESGRPVLRLLVCDKFGHYPPGPFGDQLKMTGVIND